MCAPGLLGKIPAIYIQHVLLNCELRKGETVDDDLELQNFKKAAEVLADVWTDHVIDNYPVTAVASFDQDNADVTYPSEVWIRDYVCTSQYMLQMRKMQKTEDVAPLKDPTFQKCWRGFSRPRPGEGSKSRQWTSTM